MTIKAVQATLRRFGPMTSRQLAQAMRMSFAGVNKDIRVAREHGSLFLRIVGSKGRAKIFDVGPDPDAPEGASVCDRILGALKELKGATVTELAEHLGISRSSVNTAIRRMRAQDDADGPPDRRRFHITSWKRNFQGAGREGGIYKLGGGDDATRIDKGTRMREFNVRRRERVQQQRLLQRQDKMRA